MRKFHLNVKNKTGKRAVIASAFLAALLAFSQGYAQLQSGKDPTVRNPRPRRPPNSADARLETTLEAYQTPAGETREAKEIADFLTRTEDQSYDYYWSGLNFSSPEDYEASLVPYRRAFIDAIGIPYALRNRQGVSLVSSRLVKIVDNVQIYRWVILLERSNIRQEALVAIPPGRKTPYPVMVGFGGNAGTPERIFGLDPHGFDYHKTFGLTLAKQGYFVYVPYMIVSEESRAELDNRAVGADMRLVGIETGLTMRALDYISTRPEIASDRIGVFGISNGGLLSTYLGAADTRIGVTVESGAFVDPKSYFKVFAKDNTSYYRYRGDNTTFTRATLPYLIAPRSFFVEYGEQDFLIPFHVKEAFEKVRSVYSRLSADDNVGIEGSPGEHEVYLKGSLDFIKRWIAPAPEGKD
jgi:hypothetical protein